MRANDIEDHLQARMHAQSNGGDAPPWECPPLEAYADEPRAQPTKEQKPFFRHAHEVVAEMRETHWLLHKILEARVLAVIAGARSTFKSFIGLDWLMRIALNGHSTPPIDSAQRRASTTPARRHTVVILSGESAGLDRRIDAWMRTHAPDVDLKSLSILIRERPLNLSVCVDMEELRTAIEALPSAPVVVMVDTFSKFSAGLDENDNSKVAAYLAALSECIRDAFKCTVLLIVHTGHGDPMRPRGAYALMANPDAEYIVERPSPAAMTVSVTRDRFKDGAALPPLAYEARLVDLGRRDSHGDPVDSLVLHSTDAPPPIRTKGKGRNQEKIIGALKEWTRNHPGEGHITSIDIRAICKAQGLNRHRTAEVLESFVAQRILSPAVAGYLLHSENL